MSINKLTKPSTQTPAGILAGRMVAGFVMRGPPVRLYLCVSPGTASSHPASAAESAWSLALAASGAVGALDAGTTAFVDDMAG
jgi:hypothetical protein